MNTRSTPTLAAVAPVTTCSRLARCSVCGRITNDFVMYGSLFLTDEYPSECPHICGSDCMEIACDKIATREWEVPVLRKACGAHAHDISKPRKGYDAQPRQGDLVAVLIHTGNVQADLPATVDSASRKDVNAG